MARGMRGLRGRLEAAVVLLCIVVAGTACHGTNAADDAASSATPGSQPTPSPGVVAYDEMTSLSNDVGARVTGTADEERAADFVKAALESYGYEVVVQPLRIPLGAGKSGESANITAVKTGDSPQQIIVGAHYDSVKVGRGAFDNASGVGVLLEVAQRLEVAKTPYSIRFVAFGAEEIGMRGSKSYVAHMSAQDRANTIAMVNLDSVAGGDRLYVYSDKGSAGWPRDEVLGFAQSAGIQLATNPGFNEHYPAGTTGDWSDHAPFRKAGFPYLYFEATNWNIGEKDGYLATRSAGELWHTPNDTLDFISKEFPGRVEAQLTAVVQLLQQFLTTPVPAAGR